ncbi:MULTISPECIES: Fic family protein [unclassified Empedobacter]|uniref:Fic family protein n=1 Tax=unclassified Empedobacter TaxID=2643773 RepID=UPI0025C1C8D2|nr:MULTISPECIES: Fic family protein [unclassified Empedobacter]
MSATFSPYELSLIQPDFDSPLTDLIIELEHLRKKDLGGSTHPAVFFQLKSIFHWLESMGSARIEGNNTTIAEYVETKIDDSPRALTSKLLEIDNIDEAMEFIEDKVKEYPINRIMISELHKIAVNNLPPPPYGEGDLTPGAYRNHSLKINNSTHLPPEPYLVESYMEELFSFINSENSTKYDLLKAAIAHHRFVWIHPFGNGNGRTVRLFTYAMLVKSGLNINAGRIINPTAVFCSNRNIYYDMLSKADTGTKEGILEWCEYVLRGLKEEIEKVDKLSDYNYLKSKILIPAINYSLERKFVTDVEAKILKKTVELQVIKNDDLKDILSNKNTSQISREIKKLVDKKMLIPEEEGARRYILMFQNNHLLRGVIHLLDIEGFLPVNDN